MNNQTNVSADELRAMTDSEFLAHLRKFSYPSQWIDGAAFAYAEYYLALLNGRRYSQTGNISAFTNSIR